YFGQFLFQCPVLLQWKHLPFFAMPPVGFKA
ncbi:hypothetical protein A2U01_0118640, partial [Trifolium medium]|nr:hypothetical protein [Trifolium medium]